MRARSLLESFNYAIRGVMWAYKHERNFKIHTVVSALVIIMGTVLHISKYEFLITLICIGMVLGGELINTAIEKVCDGITGEFKVYIKAAKDIAAGSVLVMSFISGIIGAIIFGNALIEYEGVSLNHIINNKNYIGIMVFVIVVFLVLFIKISVGRGTPMQGGIPSGHSAISFAIATIISLYGRSIIIMVLSFLLAVIVAESRVESKIHNLTEVMLGAILGILVTLCVLGVITIVT